MKKIRLLVFLPLIMIISLLTVSLKVEAAAKNVSDWDSFRAAIRDTSVDKIIIDGPFTSGSTLTNVDRELEIEGNGHSIDFRNRSLGISSNGKVTVSDLNFTGTSSIFSGSGGELILKGNISSEENNTAALANMTRESHVKIDGAKMSYSRGTNSSAGIISKDLTVTNGATVNSTALALYETTTNGGLTTIDKASVINAESYGTGNNSSGQLFKYNNVADIYIRDEGTEVNLSGNIFTSGNDGGLFTVQSDNSSINVLDGAKMSLLSERTTALVMYSRGGVFNVKNGSELNFESNGNYNVYGGTIRFRIRGENTFDIDNNSKVTILKTGKNNSNKNSILPPAIRMSGADNKVFVRNNSEFRVINEGNVNETNSNTGGDLGNQGLLYNAGSGNEFVVDGANSSIDIEAKYGAAIDAKSAGIDITAGADTYFVTRGATASVNDAVFSAGDMTVNMTKPRYFDFASRNSQVFENNSRSGMTVIGSDLSVWQKGANLEGNPFKSWTLIDYELSGANFNNIVSSSNADFLNTFNKMSNYSKMTANNQSAKVNSIRVPTNADKSIYVDVTVPEGKYDEDRPAFDNEVGVRIGLYDENNKEITQLTTRTSTESVYGDAEKLGVAKFDMPKNEFIKAGTKVKVISAWRGSGEENSNTVHMSRPEDILAKEVVSVDVTPPKKASVDLTEMTNNRKKISGTSKENGAKIFFKNDGVWLKNNQNELLTTEVVDGKWSIELPYYLKENSTFEIYLKNEIEIDISNIDYELPNTYTEEPNGVFGNINVSSIGYDSYIGYHDAIKDSRFDSSRLLNVDNATPPTPKINKLVRSLTQDSHGNQIPETNGEPIDSSEWAGTSTKVGNTLAYRIIVQIPGKKGEETERILYNANITDTIPEHLDFNKEDVKVWKYENGDSLGYPYRYIDNVLENDGSHKYNMGDIDLEKSKATELTKNVIDYDAETRLLTVGIGDTDNKVNTEYEGDNKHGVLLPGDKIVLEIKTKVTPDAVKGTIKNKATITGFSGVVEKEEPLTYKKIQVESNIASNPGGEISGELTLTSAPEKIVFPKTNLIDYNKAVGSELDQPLIVTDTLKTQNWQVTVKLIEQMSIKKSGDIYELPNSLYVRYKGNDSFLQLNAPALVYESDLANESSGKEIFNISDDWGESPKADGLKMKGSKVPMTGEYKGTVEWTLENTQ